MSEKCSSGTWQVDFTDVFDLVEGTDGRSEVRDEQGNATAVDWRIPNPHFTAFPEWESIEGWEWPEGAVVLQQPSGQWMSATVRARALSTAAQRASGRPGRPVAGGREVMVLRRDLEIRAAIVGPNGLRRSWRLTSETPLAEVQLAEPEGNGLVLVVRVYTDDRDEFVVLVLGEHGLVQKLAIDSADWAETAPLSRFRLVGSSLYRLGSTPAGLFVDRFDLEVT